MAVGEAVVRRRSTEGHLPQEDYRMRFPCLQKSARSYRLSQKRTEMIANSGFPVRGALIELTGRRTKRIYQFDPQNV